MSQLTITQKLKRPFLFIARLWQYFKDRLYVKMYMHRARMEAVPRKELVARIKQLALDFYDVGRRSKYIPKDIKTRAQLRAYIIDTYGDDMLKNKLRIDEKLNLKPIK